VWSYDRVFTRDFKDFDLPGFSAPNPAKIEVAIKQLEPLREGDRTLKRVKGWVRLVIWDNLVTDCRTPHVNVDSDLIPLLKANVQGFGSGPHPDYSAYVVDYDTELVKFRKGSEPWLGPINVPTELLSLYQQRETTIRQRFRRLFER